MQRSFPKRLFRDSIALFTPPQKKGLRILTYHSISNIGVTVDNFRCQMEYLKENYNVIPLGRVDSVSNEEMDRPPVAITFDDGYEDNFTEAFPIMIRLNMPFAIFLVTGFLGKVPPAQYKLYPQLKMLDETQVKEMASSGFVSFARHSHLHLDFSFEPEKTLSEDLRANGGIVKEICGNAALNDHIAYPFGKLPKIEISHFDKDIKYAYIVDNRIATYKPFSNSNNQISRILVDSTDSMVQFKWKMNAKYRTVSHASRFLKQSFTQLNNHSRNDC